MIDIALTLFTCKRLDCFYETIYAFSNNVSDWNEIKKIYVFDDNSEIEELRYMEEILKKFLPDKDIIFIAKRGLKGQDKSFKLMLDIVQEKYVFHLEDDWTIVLEENYIHEAMAVFKKHKKVKQFNLTYGIPQSPYFDLNGKKKYYSTLDKKRDNHWHGQFCFAPGVYDISALKKLKYDFNEKYEWSIERAFSEVYSQKYLSSYLIKNATIHIGGEESAFSLNKVKR